MYFMSIRGGGGEMVKHVAAAPLDDARNIFGRAGRYTYKYVVNTLRVYFYDIKR